MNNSPIVIFLHGLESGPDGLKIQHMRACAEAMGWRTLAPDGRFSRDPNCRRDAVLAHWPHEARAVFLVGSSMGGFVAAATAAALAAHKTANKPSPSEPTQDTPQAQPVILSPANLCGMLLLCPAFDLAGYPLNRPAQALPGAAIGFVHGRHDSVVPLTHSQRAAQAWGAELLVVEDDHSLHNSIAHICEVLARRLACALEQA